MDIELDKIDEVRQGAQAVLEALRRRTSEEIHSYPSPIAGCDAQFNHLLEQRTAIVDELQRLQKLAEVRADTRRYVQALDDFLENCMFLDEVARRNLRAGLRQPETTVRSGAPSQFVLRR
ncbi:MAG TPA: hypothetical protein VNK52_07060 [Hyphomicrobiaceae bacterium]|nr:hypothetical protein [Hyphomicrobiaceae bacterium]